MSEITYMAYADNVKNVYAATAKQAALKFFETYPSKRKCCISSGIHNDGFFTVTYDLRSKVKTSWFDVTKKNICDLPE